MMNKTEFKPESYCGLYCASCPIYAANLNEQAEAKGYPKCSGCKSSTVAEWCQQCGIKTCAREKGFDTCVECSSYPCVQLKEFQEDKNLPYHQEVFDCLATIKEKGEAQWIKEMEIRWKCNECGTSYDWWTQKCTSCGAAVKGYKQP